MNKPLHLVLKCNRTHTKSLRLPQHFAICTHVIQKYGKRFFVKIEQMTVQADHIHLIIRISQRSQSHNFLRVVAGQIAQRLQQMGLAKVSLKHIPDPALPKYKKQHQRTRFWKWRPYTRMVIGYKAWRGLQNYLQLNELEAGAKIPSQRKRLSGMSGDLLRELWNGITLPKSSSAVSG